MKSLLFYAATLITLAVNPTVGLGGCDECLTSTGVFFGHLTDHYGVRYQQAILEFEVCDVLLVPSGRDPKQCRGHVKKYWPGINHVLYDKGMVGPFCDKATGLNCTKPIEQLIEDQIGDWQECDDCMLEIAQYGSVFIYPEDEIEIEHYLKNEGYCMNEQLPYDIKERQECQKFLTGFVTPAMITLYNHMIEGSQDICHFWYGACPGA